jgi:hypothetical protein
MAFLPLPHHTGHVTPFGSLADPLWVTCGSVTWWGNGIPADFERQSANLGEGGGYGLGSHLAVHPTQGIVGFCLFLLNYMTYA